MTAVTLGFKAFDAHELLCHFVAAEAGLYAKQKLRVELADITFIAESDLPVDWFQASCGAALSSALRGFPQRVVFVATDKPMFWMYCRREIANLRGLAQMRLATFPEFAPPYHLANIILFRAGLTDSEAVRLYVARDDTARLGLLRSGDADAAVISSAIAPARLDAMGFNNLCFFGDEIRIPTTGLAINQAFLEAEPDLTRLLVNIHKESLKLLHHDENLVSKVLRDVFDVADEHAAVTARFYQACYTQSGCTTPEIAQAAIESVSEPLKAGKPPHWREIYPG